jgi:hypothetical protein
MFEDNYDHIKHAELQAGFRSGANWFYWIAALTLVTSIISLLGGGWRFFLSLGITQVIDGLAVVFSESFGDATKVIAIVLDIFITAMFAGFAYLANKRQLWAYIAGMVVFLLDGLLSLVFFDLIGILVHGFVLFMMIRGYMAGREMLALERAMSKAAQANQAAEAAAAQAAPEPAPASSF